MLNQFEKMLKGYKKNPWIFKGDNVEKILTTLAHVVNDWDEFDTNRNQRQFNVSSYDIPMWNGLAYYINNISVAQTYDLSHVTIVYKDEFIEKVEEYLTTGRVYLTN